MVELTNAQEEILDSLRQAVWNGNFQEVQNVLDNNEHNDIQAVLSHEGTLTSDKGTILNDVIGCTKTSVNTKVGIIELIWQKADQETRDFLCDYKVVNSFEGQPYFVDTIDGLKPFQQKIDPNNTEYSALAQVIQEIEDHKWVKDLYSNAPIVTNTTTPTTGNKTPEKNETTFWSEHKGKISLGVGGLCAVGAIAAYVLAYPAVALALTVLAAVILMGAGIAKVLENSSVEKPFTQQQEVH
ncbi:hypothetical protein INQ25_02050 [Wolbachia endosymbiont of Rhagoletis cerasi]|uniref:hypothetical protein n=1 Tax=Wolbachia endosymbiont of Rhagoletis cerasi TaxID=225363 RepID=UPI001BD279C1|nr:hypothetical protein [Wolbachia endosymbiont of Rhagoletis cerasi]MBS9530186.1 hypothetical protein [Wolbachia endosymbiont of Rhagoletis cerasi]